MRTVVANLKGREAVMSKVIVSDSTYETRKKAVREAFSAFSPDVKGKEVAVKVNALKAGDPDRQAFVTHYKVLEAVIEELEKLEPAQILVGDSVSTDSYGNSHQVFQVTRLREVAGAYNRNFSKNLRLIELKKPFKRTIAVLNDVLESDVYISVPKMKTHGLTILSGAVKNNFGLMAGAQKSCYHYYCVKPEIFAEILIEMFHLRPPDLVIMDGILAMEEYGPASPETRWMNKILASDDPVLARIVGFHVNDVPYLRLARDRGFGETNLNAIEILGEASIIKENHRPPPPEASYRYRAGVGSGMQGSL